MLLGYQGTGYRKPGTGDADLRPPSPIPHPLSPILPYILPTLVPLGSIPLQAATGRRNSLLAQGGYGIRPQPLLNPLRSLALIVAPLPGSEHADPAWLVPVGAVVACVLLLVLVAPLSFGFSP